MRLTPTQQRLYDILKDGLPHTRAELTASLWDAAAAAPDADPSYANALGVHIHNVRRAISSLGLDIVSRGDNGTTSYVLMRCLADPKPA